MKPRDFASWAEQVIGQSPAIAVASRAAIEDPPYVTHIETAAGGQIYIQWVGGTPPTGSAPVGEPDPVVSGPPAEPVKIPDLATSGRLRTRDIEQHLAALLNNGGHEEVLSVVGYSAADPQDRGSQPYGLRVKLHSGGTIFGLFRHTLSKGQQPGQNTEFNQREEV